MAGTFAGQILGAGLLSGSKNTLYTCPVGARAYVKYMSCFNVSNAQQTVILYLNPGSNSTIFAKAVLNSSESLRSVQDESLVLAPGQTIEGETSNAGFTNYLISGLEET